ncbi:MAG: YoaK family protein [Saprospiraceae bacterium]
MFRHQGRKRTWKHNLQIAIVLSFVAGIVNVSGFLAISQLTTNVTGHFALFINEVANMDWWKGTIFLAYILSFLAGSMTSALLIEWFNETKRLNIFVWPTIIESIILLFAGIFGSWLVFRNPDLLAFLLLFAMGLQNSYVTKISNAVVRTTHLTGLFTDLGIELIQLFFPKAHPKRKRIIETIKLRIYIICFFFLGGLIGGYFYSKMNWGLLTLIPAAVILTGSLFYDDFRFRVIRVRRKLK